VDHVEGFLFDQTTLLVSEDGENLRTRKTPIAFLATGRYWVNNHAHVLVARPEADLRYLAYAVEHSDVSGYLTGSTQPKLTAENLRNLPLRLPPINEQRRIADILANVDALISTNAALVQPLRDLAVMRVSSACTLGQVTRVGDVADLRRGLSYKGSGLAETGTPMVNMGSAENFGWLKRSGWKYYTGEHKARHIAHAGDLVVMNTEQTWRNEILGWPLLVPDDVSQCLFTHHTYLVEFNAGSEWLRLPLWAHLFSLEARAELTSKVQGSTVANLPIEALADLRFPAPQQADPAIGIASKLLAAAWDAEREVARLSAVRDELIPLLFTGRVSVREVAA
jgi:type I restriction enzyme S subunit